MISGKVWIFGDNINTDLMVPTHSLYFSSEEQKMHVFAANRPGWVNLVRPGDIMVAGRDFGMGSSRPAARSLRNLGISCLLADSINGLFFRNAVNFGFIALECPSVSEIFTEGHVGEVSLPQWRVRNCDTGQELPISPVPKPLLDMMLNGGVFPHLEKEGLIAPTASAVGKT